MIKEKTIKVYEFDDVAYSVEVIESDQDVEFWLQKKDYGVKSLMFGIPKQNDDKNYLDLIRANILNHIRIYESQYVC